MIGWLAQTTYTTTTSSGSVAGLLAVIFVIFIALYLLTAFALLGVFRKSGQPAWAAFVPVANAWFLFETAGQPGWWALVGLIPFCGGIIALVLWIIASIDLAKSFGKGGGFAVGLIFLSVIFLFILGYGSAEYQGPAGRRASSGGYGGGYPPPPVGGYPSPPPAPTAPGWAPPQ